MTFPSKEIELIQIWVCKVSLEKVESKLNLISRKNTFAFIFFTKISYHHSYSRERNITEGFLWSDYG